MADESVVSDMELEVVLALPGVTAARRELGELVIDVARDAVRTLLCRLRDELAFTQVMDICAVDYPQRPLRFDIVYNLLSVTRNQRIRAIVTTDEISPVPSVSEVWPCATWWEREIWDLFGVGFMGLADHRRILSDYNFEGHAMRKDFPLTGFVEVHYDDERKAVVYDKVRLTQEFRNFDFLSPWEGMTSLPGDEKAHGGNR